MTDKRLRTLARQVIGRSVRLRPGEKLLIEAWDDTEELVKALVKETQAAGGIPFVELKNSRLHRQLLMGVSEEGMEAWYRYELARMKEMDAYIAVRGQDNIYEVCDVPSQDMERYQKFYGKLHYGQRLSHTKWCLLHYPSAASAQMAGMSTEAFEEFYFDACCLDYKRLNERITPLRRRFAAGDQVRLAAPGTDITFSVKGLCSPVATAGIWNIPCGETGMQVVPKSANGVITYNLPSAFQGFVFRDIRLTLRDGKIVEAVCNDTERLNRILDTDEGARGIGEFSMGVNPFITRPVCDTLFDEKMTMSLHFTPGNSKVNPSSIHWDMVTSHAPEYGGGEVWLDGELIRKDGLFLPEELQGLNPQPLCSYVAPKYD